MSVHTSHAYLASMPYPSLAYPAAAPAGSNGAAPDQTNGQPAPGPQPAPNGRTGLDDYIQTATAAASPVSPNASSNVAVSDYGVVPNDSLYSRDSIGTAANDDSTGMGDPLDSSSPSPTNSPTVNDAQTGKKKKTSLAATNPGLAGATAVTGAALASAIIAGIVMSRQPAAIAMKSTAPTLPPHLALLTDEHINVLADAMSKDSEARLKCYSPMNFAEYRTPEGARRILTSERAWPQKSNSPERYIARRYAALHEGTPVGYIGITPGDRTQRPNLAYWFTDSKISNRPKGEAAKSVAAAIEDTFKFHPHLQGIDAVTFADNKGSRSVIDALEKNYNFKVTQYKGSDRPVWAIEQESALQKPHVAFHISRMPAR